MVDTIKRIEPDGRVSTQDRSVLRAAQTPHALDYRRLLEYHRLAREEGVAVTDDATKADFDRLSMNVIPDMRVGHGFDAHRLVEGRKLVLCGMEIPCERGLDGHSDADVAVHALMDALLGALGLGDIGRHFPDNDPRYKGISSMKLLAEVMRRVRERGYHVINADVTIVAQRPKLLSYMPAMRANIAEGLGVSAERVNVKATTTERMGYEGRGEGISAQAVALLARAGGEEKL